ncbi:hypothetical protein ACFQ51_46740 [Streptomyces kaempferi]
MVTRVGVVEGGRLLLPAAPPIWSGARVTEPVAVTGPMADARSMRPPPCSLTLVPGTV